MSDDIVREFLVEAVENLDLLDRELIQLENDPANCNTLAGVFRTIHSIKGACGFLGFKKLEAVAHVGESLLSLLRDGEITLTPEMITVLLRMVDAIRQMLQSIEAVGSEGERNDEDLKKTLTRLQQRKKASGTPCAKFLAAPSLESPRAPEPEPALTIGELLVQSGAVTPAEVATAIAMQSAGDPRRLGEIMVASGAVKPQEIVEALRSQEARPATSDGSIRVEVVLLDKLMNLVGELVLARNQILQFSNSSEDAAIVVPSQQLNLLTTELREGVMKTRMQPIGNIWSKFPRTVRDISITLGKQVRIEMEGEETALDRTIIEAIKDPLMHIVRNSVDHGIERPEVRVAQGKKPEGVLSLRAYHADGQVNIEIGDDGAGLDLEGIKRKAVERRLLTPEKAAQFTDSDTVNLLFFPGFSTAETITNLSGRGVGMDVVRTNIEKIGGTVDLQSVFGAGSIVKMRIPLTLAIIPGLVVLAANKRFIIPQVSLIELVRIEGDQTRAAIEMVHGAPVYRLRGRLLPLIYLDRELRLEKVQSGGLPKDDVVNIVVLQADGRQFGLIVDEIRDTEEIVVKPLGRRLKSIKSFAGATIMGDGRVALILDVRGVALRANIISAVQDRAAVEVAESTQKIDEKQTFVVFDGPDKARMALPLGALARLEEFPASQIEKSGAQSVIQYRGQILPLIHLKDALQERRRRPRHPHAAPALPADSIKVLVCHHGGQAVGLVVEQILDIVEDCADVKSPATRAGVLYAAVIDNRVTELLDLPVILLAVSCIPDHQEEHAEVSE